MRARPKLKKWRKALSVSWFLTWRQMSLTDACRAAGVSKATYYRWLQRWPDVAADYERARALRWSLVDDIRFESDARRFLKWPPIVNCRTPREISPRKVFHPCAHVREWKGVKVTKQGLPEVYFVKQQVLESDPDLFRVAGLTLGSIQKRSYYKNSWGNWVPLPMI